MRPSIVLSNEVTGSICFSCDSLKDTTLCPWNSGTEGERMSLKSMV